MMSISKPLSAGKAQRYHQKEFTAKEWNHWSQPGVIVGEWQGRLGVRLGLVGLVSTEDFARLSEGRHPGTGEQLVRKRAPFEYHNARGKTIKTMEHLAGLDATFSAPKSVSLTALVGGDDRVREAHRESVNEALKQLEYYVLARIGHNRLPEITAKFIAAKFEHDAARPVNGYAAPQLHTHAVVFNLTQRADGQYRALQFREIFRSQQFATAIYRSELTYRLHQLGYEITSGKSGAPEIKGYTQEYLDASSPRRKQIREYLERTGHKGPAAAGIAALSTRDRKESLSPSEMMAMHRKLAAQFGHQADAVVRGARERQQHQQRPASDVDRVQESLTFSRDKNFEHHAVVDERVLIRDGLFCSMGDVTYAQVRVNLDARIASGEFQAVERAYVPGRRFTTAKTIADQNEIVRRVREGRNQVEPVLPRSEAISVADQLRHLNRTQKGVVELVLSSPDRIQAVQGFPYSGRTSTLSVIRSATEFQGYKVEGFAQTSRSTRQLCQAGVETGTLQGFAARSTAPRITEQKHLYFVDESSLSCTNQMREFLSRLAPQDRVLLIGDSRRHQDVHALRPFEQLQAAGMRTGKLDGILGQMDPELKNAFEVLATGRVSAALDALQKQGRVREIPDAVERIRAIAKSYVDSPGKTLIVTVDHHSQRELNGAVRQELKANGAIAAEDHYFRVLVERRDMTGTERSWAGCYKVNDLVRYVRGSKNAGIGAGEYGTVLSVNTVANLLTVETPTGRLIVYDPRRLCGVGVYHEVDREFSPGDRIQFTAQDKSLRAAKGDLAVIESVTPGGLLAARLEDDRQIKFYARDHRHFDHGYAFTGRSLEGLTAERVLVNAETGMHPNLLNPRFGDAFISRVSREATVFTDNVNSLGQHLGKEPTEIPGLNLNPSPSLTLEIGMNS
jgi:conjugative relaxase-like TrwC/TraI family protein